MTKIRTRFAPSPTGYLHIGGLRTALFALLIARSQNGKLIFRLEDTDQKRLVKDAADKLIKTLDWAGIKFDEGPHLGGEYGPYVQSERREIYKKYCTELIDKKKAYYCFCTEDRLMKIRKKQQQEKKPPRYDRCCRNLSEEQIADKIKAGIPYVVRQKMPLTGTVKVFDELRGEIVFRADELEDHVLIKSNGMPTYQFAVVVDDHLMEISHVVRGEEWIPSFPKNALLYRFFGWSEPKFIHLPLILNKNGGKLSKRKGDASVEDFIKKGYLAEALINFTALLGWHPKGDKEIFGLEELFKKFKISNMGVSSAVFDIAKLDFFNSYYIRQKNVDDLTDLCWPYLQDNITKSSSRHKQSKEFAKKAIKTEQERMKQLSEIGDLTEFYYVDKLDLDSAMLPWKKTTTQATKDNLLTILEIVHKIPDKNWTNDSIEDSIITYLQAAKLKIGEYLWPMRVALTGRRASPGPFEVAEVLGKQETIERIKDAAKLLA